MTAHPRVVVVIPSWIIYVMYRYGFQVDVPAMEKRKTMPPVPQTGEALLTDGGERHGNAPCAHS